MVAGCGFSSGDATGAPDAPGPAVDADPIGGDGGGGGDPARCLAAWRRGDVELSPPARIALAAPAGDRREPAVSADERTLLFTAGGDIYAAARASRDDAFEAAVRRADLSAPAPALDHRASLSADGLTAVIVSDRAGGRGAADLWLATRATAAGTFAAPTQAGLAALNDAGAQLDATLSADGLRLYFAQGAPQRLVVAVRPAAGAPFAAAQPLSSLASDTGDGDPAVSSDDRLIVYASRRERGLGGSDLWFAVRDDATPGTPFGAPRHLASLSSPAGDADPALSADACRVYFASDREGGWALYVSTVVPPAP